MSNQLWFTTLAVVMLLMVLVATWRSLRIFPKRRVSRSYMQYLVSVRSAFIFLAMVAPILATKLWASLPDNFTKLYCWIPFWFCFMVTPTLGGTLHILYHVIRGVGIATLALALLNYLMPGGAGQTDKHNIEAAWLPGGYNTPCAYIYILVFVYVTFASRLSVDTKYFILAMFAQSIVIFMNPSDTAFVKSGVLWDWEFHVSWHGPVPCQIYVILLAAVCAVLAVPVLGCSRRYREEYLCKAQANKGLQELARDSIACLEKLILHFREDTASYALESSFLYIRQLGTRRTAIENLLYEARWECYSSASLLRLLRVGQFSDLMRSFRQVLRIELDLLRSAGDAIDKSQHADVVGDHLQNFLVSSRDALTALSEGPDLGRPLDEKTHEEVSRMILQADQALRMALQALRSRNANSQSSLISTAFVDSLRIWTSSMIEFLNAKPPEDRRPGVFTRLSPDRLFSSGEQHMNALRLTISWMLALLWSLYQRPYQSGCVVCLSFTFSATMGSLFDKNINRMLGVSMGLVLGNLPAVMLMEQPGSQSALGDFVLLPQGMIIYISAMWITWTLAMYGYLGTGAKYSYGCMLWAGFSGTQLLWHLQPKRVHGYDIKATVFLDMMDQFIAVFIVLVVELLFARFFGGLTLDRVAKAVPLCLENISALVDEFIRNGPLDANISDLQKSIMTSRFWDGEAKSEDLVWSLLWSAPYKADLIQIILDQCDDVYVASYAIKASAERCGGATAKAILSDMFVTSSPRQAGYCNLSEHARRYARIVRAALTEDLQIASTELRKASSDEVSMTAQSMRRGCISSPLLETLTDNFSEVSLMSPVDSPETILSPAVGRTDLVPCSWSAAVALRANACALRLALQRMEVLIREHEFWVSEAWAFSALQREVSNEDRFLTSACGTPARSRTSTLEHVSSVHLGN